MKLTVGPMPSAVYWRRRLLVLGVLLILMIITWASCSGSDGDGKRDRSRGAAGTGASQASSASTAPSSEPPTVTSPTTPVSTPASTPAGTESSTPAVNPAPPVCADAEILVTPEPQSASSPRGAAQTLYLKIKNVSSRPCPRDVGPGAQELYLEQGSSKVWSSDECNPSRQNKVQVESLAPNIEHKSYVQWSGMFYTSTCGKKSPPAGKYQLYGRLGTKVSEPVTVTLT